MSSNQADIATAPNSGVKAPIPDKESLAQLCKAAGDALRMDILLALSTDSYGVLELAEAFSVKQSGMSHHLKILASAGLVSSRREGNSIFYRRANTHLEDPLYAIKRALFESLAGQKLAEELEERFAAIHAERARISHQFFVDNANKFREQQDLIASYPIYETQISELLQSTKTPQQLNALEVGPGEGEFLPILHQAFSQVTALDNNPAMLAKSQQFVTGETLNNIEFVCGDTSKLAGLSQRFDCAVINMVLHHTPSPRQIFFDVFESLVSGGALLLTELCHHNQEWVREACGDVWLGFEPEDLKTWANDAGFEQGESVYFALRNGFQIQLQQFFKPNLGIAS